MAMAGRDDASQQGMEAAQAGIAVGAATLRTAGDEWLGFQRRSILRAIDSFEALWRCRTLDDLLSIQLRYAADVIEDGWSRSARLAAAAREVDSHGKSGG
jgi:hypothetical protein